MENEGQLYCSTFISGFGEIVKDALALKLPDVKIEALFDGLVLYQTAAPVAAVQKVRFFNNSFLRLSQDRCSSSQAVEGMVKRLFGKAQLKTAVSVVAAQRLRTFRVMVSKENTTVALRPELLAGIEKTLAQQLKLRVHRSLPDAEFWFLLRSEGLCLFGLRLTAIGKERTRKYARGELRQELAHLLCLLSEPERKDVFLDPFCGSGAIVLERLLHFPYQQVLAGDNNPEHVAALRQRTSLQKQVTVKQWDALHMTGVPSRSIRKIVTDPPWGFYNATEVDFVEFYAGMLAEFARVLQPGGLVVVLVGRKLEFEAALARLTGQLQLRKKYDILVSGKKAGVYQLARVE